MIYAYLHGMEALIGLREPALRALCACVRYQWHDANEVIYWLVLPCIYLFKIFINKTKSATTTLHIL